MTLSCRDILKPLQEQYVVTRGLSTKPKVMKESKRSDNWLLFNICGIYELLWYDAAYMMLYGTGQMVMVMMMVMFLWLGLDNILDLLAICNDHWRQRVRLWLWQYLAMIPGGTDSSRVDRSRPSNNGGGGAGCICHCNELRLCTTRRSLLGRMDKWQCRLSRVGGHEG